MTTNPPNKKAPSGEQSATPCGGGRIGLFAGSFDPFTVGHKSIVDRALPLFDRLVIGFGVNPAKKPWMPLEERMARVRELYRDDPRVEVVEFTGLTIEFARQCGASYLVRGVRGVADFDAERTMAEANRILSSSAGLPPIETIILPALPEAGAVSSSLVRELARFGAPYRQFIP